MRPSKNKNNPSPLFIRNTTIKNLKGIEKLISLCNSVTPEKNITLEIVDNDYLESLEGLEELTAWKNLTKLEIGSNENLKDIDSIGVLKQLKRLEIIDTDRLPLGINFENLEYYWNNGKVIITNFPLYNTEDLEKIKDGKSTSPSIWKIKNPARQ